MRLPPIDEEYESKTSKPSRRKKQLPKTHRVVHEHSRGLKDFWQRLNLKKKTPKI